MNIVLALLLGGAAPHDAAQPSPQIGQHFLFLANQNQVVRQGARVLPLGDVYAKVLTFRRADGRRLIFKLDGRAGEVQTTGLPAELAPLIEDSATRALRTTFQTGQAWVYGGGPLECRPLDGAYVLFKGPATQAVKVLNIWRVNRPTQVEFSNHNGLGPFPTVAQPFVVQVARPATFTFVAAGMNRASDFKMLMDHPACQRLTQVFADERHVFRVLSATAPSAVSAQELTGAIVGLSKAAALQRFGAPNEPAGPVEAVLSADTWTWAGPPGRGDFVLHFEGGRVARYEEPSRGP